MFNKKIASEIAVGMILLVAIAIGWIFWWQRLIDSKEQTEDSNEQKACTMEAKLCNDGSYVSRTGPNCEFALCPEKNTKTADDIANWQTYKNEDYGLEFKYPNDLKAEENHSVDFFSLDIREAENNQDIAGLRLHFNLSAKKTNYKNTNDWFAANKKESEKPVNYEGTIINTKVDQITDLNSNGLEIKRYVTGGGNFPFYDVCAGFVKNSYEYLICSEGGVKNLDYISAKTGVDKFNNAVYDEAKLEKAKIEYRKLFDQMLYTFKFTDVKVDENADWQTYRNKKLGFELKYPSNFYVKENNPDTEKMCEAELKNESSLNKFDNDCLLPSFVVDFSNINGYCTKGGCVGTDLKSFSSPEKLKSIFIFKITQDDKKQRISEYENEFHAKKSKINRIDIYSYTIADNTNQNLVGFFSIGDNNFTIFPASKTGTEKEENIIFKKMLSTFKFTE